jgi:hypothetical protein
MYDPKLMPDGLRVTHKALDKAVERCFRARAFQNDDQRIDYLFDAYKARAAPLDVAVPARNQRVRKTA